MCCRCVCRLNQRLTTGTWGREQLHQSAGLATGGSSFGGVGRPGPESAVELLGSVVEMLREQVSGNLSQLFPCSSSSRGSGSSGSSGSSTQQQQQQQ